VGPLSPQALAVLAAVVAAGVAAPAAEGPGAPALPPGWHAAPQRLDAGYAADEPSPWPQELAVASVPLHRIAEHGGCTDVALRGSDPEPCMPWKLFIQVGDDGAAVYVGRMPRQAAGEPLPSPLHYADLTPGGSCLGDRTVWDIRFRGADGRVREATALVGRGAPAATRAAVLSVIEGVGRSPAGR
jgi:hypothetical protein